MDNRYSNNFLYFDEGPHRYTDSFGNEYKSVTTIIHDYVPKFDDKKWAHIKAVEQGKSEAQIRREWDKIKNEACARGSNTHDGIENAIKEVSMFKNAIKYLTNTESGRCITVADIPSLLPTPLDIEKFKEATEYKYDKIYDVFEFYINRGYTIYSEIGVFLMDSLISGTIDILCYRPTDFVILDWKTNRGGLKFEAGYYKKDKTTVPNQLTNEWVKKREYMLPPLAHLDNCNGMHYSLQVSMYAYMVETILQIPCAGLGLCHINSPFILNGYGQPFRDADGYHIDPNGEETINWFRIKYMKSEIHAIVKDRLNSIKAEMKRVNNQYELAL